MADKIKLLDANIPLQERYDRYLEWISQHSTVSPNIIAQELEMSIAYVEVFLDLGKLDQDEFSIIDEIEISIDSLVLIVKEDSKEKRLKIYRNYLSIVSDTNEPIKALRNFIDGDDEPLFMEKLLLVSPQAYYSIASYLKQTGIENAVMPKKFRGFIVTIGKLIEANKPISDKQCDWVVKAVAYDKAQSLKIFSNEILKNDFNKDYLIFQEIMLMISTLPVK